MAFPFIAYGTPRKLPKAKDLPGRVVVLDIAFAAQIGGASFDKVTRKLIDGLGDRLAMQAIVRVKARREVHEAYPHRWLRPQLCKLQLLYTVEPPRL